MTRYQLCVGIDMAARTATCSWCRPQIPPATAWTMAQTPDGWQTLVDQLPCTGVVPVATLVVFEATGSYGVSLATSLHTAGYAVRVINLIQAGLFTYDCDDTERSAVGSHPTCATT